MYTLQLVTLGLVTAIPICVAAAIKCDADLTTKFAIGKRQMEKQMECRMEKENIANCENVTEVNGAWQDFERINDEYSKAIFECKLTQRSKRRRMSDCGCGHHEHRESGHQLTKRNCGCGHGKDDTHRRHHDVEDIESVDDDTQLIKRRQRRHRQHNAAELQKHERGKHGRGHVHHRHGGRKSDDRPGATHRRRHDHGSNDDPNEEEEIPDAHDRSKSSLRVRRSNCILQAKRETDRLRAKYASLCDRSQICDKDNLHGEQKRTMHDLSKRRQRIYRQYLSVFDQCYGSVVS